MELVVTITDISDNGKKVTLYGTLDTQTSPSLEEKLEPLLTEKPPILIFDLSDLEFISSAGLRILFKTKKELQTWDGEMMMLKPQPQIEKVFDVIKALPDTPVFASFEEMDRYLKLVQERAIQGDKA